MKEKIVADVGNVHIVFDQECKECNGTGKSFWTDPPSDCYECGGVGFVPTEIGFAMIEMFKRHKKRYLEE